ncbi:MCE family protein [Rhodococcus sp. IEGM 1354]|uniref:MCE family protein n=1 Tax=Rhodococcus sp. IEGM 1354 TaxID=3047088 RepID=UPI0024B6ACCC|nr:MCE family protein [Rhodococcus sp. IEGM 1354]MDI9932673.1 MCE family protein [Rhodococcus sp. IEGM 1354]
MTKVGGTAVKLLAFTVAIMVCGYVVVTALRTPVSGPISTYAATFDDVSGLYEGDDVRMSGVQIGKVDSVELDGTTARVTFGVESNRAVYDTTHAAVRYQNLLGQRYVELMQDGSEPGDVMPAGSTIPLDNTVPSFDITELFDGFRPIFDTLDTDQLNLFAENILRMVQGDGSGIAPVLRDIDSITTFAEQREAIIALLIDNLGRISQTIGGKSASVADLVEQLTSLVSRLSTEMEHVLSSLDQANYGLTPLVGLAEQLRDAYDGGYAPVDGALRRLIPQTDQVTELLALAPSLLTSLNQRIPGPGQNYTCSRGQQDIPGIGQIVLGNQKLVVCR